MAVVRAQSELERIHPSIALAQKKVYTKGLGEDDILSLCDIFLKPGLHYISFSTINEGRRTINLFVDLLKCYHTIGYIDRGSKYSQGMNLYEFFAHYKNGKVLRDTLDTFFIEEFSYDFIWIVYPKYQVARTFIHIFLDQLIEYNIDQKIPVIFIST
jgi:hypothetical protein